MFPSPLRCLIHQSCAMALAIAVGWSVTSAFAADDYKIRANDTIEVKVFQEDDLSLKTRVSKEGLVNLPLIGPVRIVGLSPNVAAQRIKTAYADGYLVNPQVNVSLAEVARRNFTVLGQVSKPGVYQIPSYESVTLVQAIGMAGGYTNKANKKKVTIKRRVNGKDITKTFNARDMAKLSQSRQIAIVDGDVISIAESIF